MRALVYSKQALRTLDRLPVNLSRRIREKIQQYVDDPKSLTNLIKPLKGSDGLLRLRVGDWRVLFTESGEILRIVEVVPRGSAYR